MFSAFSPPNISQLPSIHDLPPTESVKCRSAIMEPQTVRPWAPFTSHFQSSGQLEFFFCCVCPIYIINCNDTLCLHRVDGILFLFFNMVGFIVFFSRTWDHVNNATGGHKLNGMIQARCTLQHTNLSILLV